MEDVFFLVLLDEVEKKKALNSFFLFAWTMSPLDLVAQCRTFRK